MNAHFDLKTRVSFTLALLAAATVSSCSGAFPLKLTSVKEYASQAFSG